MTKRLEQAFTEASKLSPKEQDVFADWVLAEMRSEKKWDRLFANSIFGDFTTEATIQEGFSKLL